MDNELLLFDRLEIIKTAINKYGIDNFYLSFSGGKDSTILHRLLDIALPNNRIPRVFIDTGIEYMKIREFVLKLAKEDDRFIVLKPSQPVKQMLERVGYPFKSKEHSLYVQQFQKNGMSKTVMRYLNPNESRKDYGCPKALRYQFTKDFPLKISNQCCYEMKKKPVSEWQEKNNRTITITGMRNNERGLRANIKGCVLTDKSGKLKKFHPLLVVSDEWEDWFIEREHIELCELYRPPYNFKRTGCKGCPFSLELQYQLDIMQIYLPGERKQCEMIWKPVYDEYRRLNYRLTNQMSIFDFSENTKYIENGIIEPRKENL